MKLLQKFRFVREYRDTEDKVELYDNEENRLVTLTYKQYHQMKGYYDNVRYILREDK